MADRVCICTVAEGPPKSWEYMEAIFDLRAPGGKLFRHVAGKQGVDDGHNRLIQWFLDYTDFEWMLHLDSDAVVHRDTLMRLLSWDVRFVSALAFQRRPPYVPVIYTDPNPNPEGSFKRPLGLVSEWLSQHQELLALSQPVVLNPRPDDALWKINRGGAHCCLTHRSVLESIKPPWFTRSGPGESLGAGSDFTFHAKAIEQGVQPYVDMSVVAGHMVGNLCISALDFAVWNTVVEWTKNGRPGSIEVVHTTKERMT